MIMDQLLLILCDRQLDPRFAKRLLGMLHSALTRAGAMASAALKQASAMPLKSMFNTLSYAGGAVLGVVFFVSNH